MTPHVLELAGRAGSGFGWDRRNGRPSKIFPAPHTTQNEFRIRSFMTWPSTRTTNLPAGSF